ncbi:MAG: ImmA/IrrE family metallo-endopeptidase [Ktedonobacteraceae bacterium]
MHGGTRKLPVIEQAIKAVEVIYNLVEEKLGKEQTVHLLSFPRNIETLVLFGLELPVVKQHHLTLHSAGKYLCIRRAEHEHDRPLQGLLHVGLPAAVIFVEATLSPRTKNYIIAHELGHYIYDIFMVRRLWHSSLREQEAAIVQAFSWQTSDPWLELQVLLKGLPERPHSITQRGEGMLVATRKRELVANAIALELLAPWKEASQLFGRYRQAECVIHLREDYGVPFRVAENYYTDLQHVLTPQTDLFDQVFAPLRHVKSS